MGFTAKMKGTQGLPQRVREAGDFAVALAAGDVGREHWNEARRAIKLEMGKREPGAGLDNDRSEQDLTAKDDRYQ